MSSATESRSPVNPPARPRKPQRFCRLNGKPTVDEPAFLTLHVAAKETDYLIRPVPSNFGERFGLTKLEFVDDGPAERGEVYHVCFEDQFNHACECKGFLRYGHCKHLDSVKALREHGRIEPLPSAGGVRLPRPSFSGKDHGMNDTHPIAERLAATFPASEVRWEPQTVSGNRALAICYIDARAVIDRLDDVLGIDGWTDAYELLPYGAVVCTLKAKIGNDWITKQDVGGPSEQPDDGDRRKAAFSDALKRAAVKLGIGRYLYRCPRQWIDYDPQKRQFTSTPALPPSALPVAPRPKAAAPADPLADNDFHGPAALARRSATAANATPKPPAPPRRSDYPF
jgi:hypothetical protein